MTPAFTPAPGDAVSLPVTTVAATHLLPKRKPSRGYHGRRSVRLTSSPNGPDIYFKFGRSDVTVTTATGQLFPAGSIEVVTLHGITHIAVVTASGNGSLNIAVGSGE